MMCELQNWMVRRLNSAYRLKIMHEQGKTDLADFCWVLLVFVVLGLIALPVRVLRPLNRRKFYCKKEVKK